MSAARHFELYGGRLLLDGNPSDLVAKIPMSLLAKLPGKLRDAFDLFMIDFVKNGSIDGSRILRELCNGSSDVMTAFFAELIAAENIPDMPSIEKRIREGIVRHSKAFVEAPIVSAKDFLAEVITEAPMIIPPFFPHPGRLYLSAFSGTGKTNFALNMGAAISIGGDFLGWTPRKKTVLFLDGENPRSEIQKRARAIFRAMAADPGNIHFVFPEKPINLLQGRGLEELERMIVSSGAGVVFLDSFLNFFPVRNENDSSEVRPALDRLTLLSRTLRCSVAIIDHTMKPPRDTRFSGPPTPRGTGAKIDWSDVVIGLEEKKAEGRFLRTLYFTKTRTCPPISPVVIELDGALTFSRADENALVPTALIVEIVRESPGISPTGLIKAIRGRIEISERSVYRALDRIVGAEGSPITRKVRMKGGRAEYFPTIPGLPKLLPEALKNE